MSNNDPSPHGPAKSGLYEYLNAKLLGSSLQVVQVSESEIRVEAGDLLSLDITTDASKKTIDFVLFSKVLNRPVNVEEINGTVFMEARLEEELEKENWLSIGEDALLAIDLFHLWADQNGYSVTHDGVAEPGRQQKEPQETITPKKTEERVEKRARSKE